MSGQAHVKLCTLNTATNCEHFSKERVRKLRNATGKGLAPNLKNAPGSQETEDSLGLLTNWIRDVKTCRR